MKNTPRIPRKGSRKPTLVQVQTKPALASPSSFAEKYSRLEITNLKAFGMLQLLLDRVINLETENYQKFAGSHADTALSGIQHQVFQIQDDLISDCQSIWDEIHQKTRA